MASMECPSWRTGSGGPAPLCELLAILPAGVAYVAGPDLVFEFVNDVYQRAIGERDVIGRPYREALPEVAGRPRYTAIREVLQTGETRHVRGKEAWLRRPGAAPEHIYIDSVYQPVRDEAGRVAGVLIFSTDVSGHVRDRQRLEELADSLQRAQAGLRESNRLLGHLRDANVLGVVIADEEGIREANDAFLDIIGYTRDDLAAGRIAWEAITPPEWVHSYDEAVERMRRTGACPPYDKEYLHRDGHRVPVLVGHAVIDRNPLRWTTFVVDLTARQRDEQERAELLAREQGPGWPPTLPRTGSPCCWKPATWWPRRGVRRTCGTSYCS